jgi:hypothetical protein
VTDPHRVVQQHLEKLLRAEGNLTEILGHLESMSPHDLTSVLPTLFSTGTTGAQREALRDTINAVLYRKLTDSLVDAIGSLDASAERLAKVGWWITIVVGVVGILVTVAITFPLL